MRSIVLRLRIFIIILASVLIAGTIGFMTLEGIPPADALYFTVVTIATVGYGDIAPVTSAGRVLAAVLIIAGVGSFSGFIVNGTHLLIERRQERLRVERLNMLISLFFSEMGTRLLDILVALDPKSESLYSQFLIDGVWNDDKFANLVVKLKNHPFSIKARSSDLETLRTYLSQKGSLLLRLLENPTLAERELFTEALRATLHLRDELMLRGTIGDSPPSDLEHLSNDAKRVYATLVGEWLEYMRYLSKNYSYLFSLALRTNPFSKTRSPIVSQ